MTVLAGGILILVAVAFVALPFMGWAEAAAFVAGGDQRRQALEAQKLEAYAAIKDAELDFRMGKLTETDYQFVREKYAQEALAALAALDAGGISESRRQSDTAVAYCSACGTKTAPGGRFCGGCGQHLGVPDPR